MALALSSNACVFAFVHVHLKIADSLQAPEVLSSSTVELSTKRPDLPQGFMFQNKCTLRIGKEQGAPLVFAFQLYVDSMDTRAGRSDLTLEQQADGGRPEAQQAERLPSRVCLLHCHAPEWIMQGLCRDVLMIIFGILPRSGRA